MRAGCPKASPSSDKARSHRVYVRRVEIGRPARSGRAKAATISRSRSTIKFRQPIFANLFNDESGEGYSLIWSPPLERRVGLAPKARRCN
ncbi:MAG: DUF736 family protein [Reyranella sp.]|nr:DUF736 family protein [Reyranella sp.]MBL6654397.1 DUF736 family protein [Reyranella sp.]